MTEIREKPPAAVIFLDFDGVMVTIDSLKIRDEKSRFASFAPSAVDTLNKICVVTGADIVLSTSWRMYGVERLMPFIRRQGVTGRIIGVTPDHGEDGTRANEVMEHLAGYPVGERPNFVLLDDEDHEWHGIAKHWVPTTIERGLGLEHFDRAVSILRGEW